MGICIKKSVVVSSTNPPLAKLESDCSFVNSGTVINKRLRRDFFVKEIISAGKEIAVAKVISLKDPKLMVAKRYALSSNRVVHEQLFKVTKTQLERVLQVIYLYYEKKYVFTLHYCIEGGDLYSFILRNQFIAEVNVFFILLNLINTVENCHNNRIALKSLSPRNMLFETDDELSTFYVSGCSIIPPAKSADDAIFHQIKPSLSYPDDVWMIGCIAYFLYLGKPACVQIERKLKFVSRKLLLNCNVISHFLFETNVYVVEGDLQELIYTEIQSSKLNNETKAFLEGCLAVDPQKRFTVADCSNSDLVKTYDFYKKKALLISDLNEFFYKYCKVMETRRLVKKLLTGLNKKQATPFKKAVKPLKERITYIEMLKIMQQLSLLTSELEALNMQNMDEEYFLKTEIENYLEGHKLTFC